MNDFNVPVGYKNTEVGVIPEDWSFDKIQNLSKITTGSKNTQDKIATGKYPFFVRSQTIEHINSFSFDGEGVLTAGDGVGTGKIYHYINGKFDFHQRVYLMHSFDNRLDGYYFYLYFSNTFYDRVMSMTAKSSVDSVRRVMIADMNVALPPKEEQTAIATALSDIDNLIQSLERLISKKEAIKTATMQQLLTGKTRLPEFAICEDGNKKGFKQTELGFIPEDWEVNTLSKLSSYINDGTHYTPSYVQNGVPFYSVENVTANDFVNVKHISFEEHNRLIKRCKPERGDILMTRIGSIGKTRIIDWDVDASIYVSLALIKPSNTIKSQYMYEFSKSNLFQKEIEKRALVNATPQKINMAEIGQVQICYPESKKEQIAIATILSDMDTEIQALHTRLTKTQDIKQGMMQQLLTGKVRLVSPFNEKNNYVPADKGNH